MKRAQVPWANRREIGRFRGFWRTFTRVTFRPRVFARAVGQPVDLKEAKRFRRLVVIVLWLTLVVTAWGLSLPETLIDRLDDLDLIDDVYWDRIALGWRVALGAIASGLLVAWLYVCTGVHTYFFHPRALPVERQNRAVALSYYACAPLLWLPVAAGLLAVGLKLQLWSESYPGIFELELVGLIIALLSAAPLVLGVLEFWWVTSQLAVHAAGRGLGGRLAVMAVQPLVCLASVVVAGIVLPLCVAYAWLLLTSF